MDFVTGLPHTHSQHDSIWVIVDKMNKSAHLLSVHTLYSMEEYVILYITEMVKLHGISFSIISRRGTHCTSHFWKAFQKGFGAQVYLSTSLLPS